MAYSNRRTANQSRNPMGGPVFSRKGRSGRRGGGQNLELSWNTLESKLSAQRPSGWPSQPRLNQNGSSPALPGRQQKF